LVINVSVFSRTDHKYEKAGR